MRRAIDPESFVRLLRLLDPDLEQAGTAYERIRRRLYLFFVNNGCGVATDELVDSAIDRMILKHTVKAYALGAARNVLKEHRKRATRTVALEDNVAEPEATASGEREQMSVCLQHCLRRLSERERTLLMRRYQLESDGTDAADSDKTPNALRVELHRIRKKLHVWMSECLQRMNAA